MARLWILAIAFCAGAALAVPAPKQGRIVGGQPTTIDEYPTMVQVEFLGIFSGEWGQSCAASILNMRNVVSAAHCFHGIFYLGPQFRRIRAGATYRNTGGQVVNVEREINHPSYGLRGYDGDINVVRLTSAIVYTPVVQRARIPVQGSVVPDNVPVVHAGWGTIYEDGPMSPVLLDVTIYTINNQLCTDRYVELWPQWPVTENMICAGLLDVGGRDACQGDSGGPLYFGDVLVGVVSWGAGCANATFPGLSTTVSSYTDWLVDNAL